MSKIILIDPPDGWRYGFPKVYDKTIDETVEEWFLRNGYPQKEIDKGMLRHCWHQEVDE